MKGFQNLVTLVPWTFIFQICNLLLLAGCILFLITGIRFFLRGAVGEVSAKHREQIQTSYKGETE